MTTNETGRDAEAVRVLGLSPKRTTVEQMSIMRRALELFDERNNSEAGYEDLWKSYGWGDSLLHMRSKLSRVERRFREQAGAQQDLDDAYDLINYTVFFIRNVLAGNQDGEV